MAVSQSSEHRCLGSIPAPVAETYRLVVEMDLLLIFLQRIQDGDRSERTSKGVRMEEMILEGVCLHSSSFETVSLTELLVKEKVHRFQETCHLLHFHCHFLHPFSCFLLSHDVYFVACNRKGCCVLDIGCKLGGLRHTSIFGL